MDYAVTLVVAALSLLAVFDCLRRKAPQFERAWKRTKTFWLALTAASAVVSVLGAVSSTVNLLRVGYPGTGSMLLLLIAATIAGVYLADVKPAVAGEAESPGYW